MSVQVRRRREAASFLSSYVGAQGELLVDTTRNRVQVHDGVTPGGWPAASLADVTQRIAVADANYSALATDRTVAFTSLTASRVVTLPAASAYPTGTQLLFVDETGACSPFVTITVARAGTDTINGATSAQIASAYGFLALTSNGKGAWTTVDFAGASTAQLTNRNAAINGNFVVNQRGYASNTALASGAYGHDRFKAGSGGCTYTFTQAVPDTAITITAGSLIQAVDAPNVYATMWWLTWTGTAPARVYQGSASSQTSPAYAAGTSTNISGTTVNVLLVTGLAIGTITNVEFGTGTLGLVQLEAALPSAGPTRFERRHGEFALCQRYYRVLQGTGNDISPVNAQSNSVNIFLGDISSMRAQPTVTHTLTDANYVNGAPTGSQWFLSQPGYAGATKNGTVSFVVTPGPFFAYLTVNGSFTPLPTSLALGQTARIALSAEI